MKTKLKALQVGLMRGALMCCSMAFVVLIAETFLNFFDNYKGLAITEVDGVRVDGRDTFRVLCDYWAEGKETYPALFPAWIIQEDKQEIGQGLLPLGGISRVYSAFGSESEGFIVYKSDRFGFYNEDALWDAQPQVMIVGDSFAQSAYIAQGHTLGAVLSQKYAPTISLGMVANGPLLTYASLREFGPEVKPRVVLWFFSELNNLAKGEDEMKQPELRAYTDVHYSQNLWARQAQADRQMKKMMERQREFVLAVKASKTNSAFSSIIRLRSLRAKVNGLTKRASVQKRQQIEQKRQEDSKVIELDHFRSIIVQSQKLCATWGGELIVVYNTSWERYHPDSEVNPQRDAILSMLNHEHVRVIDAHELWAKQQDPLVYFASRDHLCHFNREGYAKLAQFIGDYLCREGLIKSAQAQ